MSQNVQREHHEGSRCYVADRLKGERSAALVEPALRLPRRDVGASEPGFESGEDSVELPARYRVLGDTDVCQRIIEAAGDEAMRGKGIELSEPPVVERACLLEDLLDPGN